MTDKQLNEVTRLMTSSREAIYHIRRKMDAVWNNLSEIVNKYDSKDYELEFEQVNSARKHILKLDGHLRNALYNKLHRRERVEKDITPADHEKIDKWRESVNTIFWDLSAWAGERPQVLTAALNAKKSLQLAEEDLSNLLIAMSVEPEKYEDEFGFLKAEEAGND